MITVTMRQLWLDQLGVEDRGAGEVVMLLQNLVDATKENSYCRIYYYSLNKMCIKIIKIYLWCDFSKNAWCDQFCEMS